MRIYKTTNLVNGKIYVGKQENKKDTYIGSGKIIKAAILKYGKNNFFKEILEECSDKNHLKEREIYWIDYYNSTNKEIGYNITKGGDGGQTLSKEQISINSKRNWANPEFREKLLKKLKEKPVVYGNFHTEESKKKMRDVKLGKKMPEEFKQKISEINYKRSYNKVMCIETEEIFLSKNAAKRWLNNTNSYKFDFLKMGDIKIIGEYTWKII